MNVTKKNELLKKYNDELLKKYNDVWNGIKDKIKEVSSGKCD